jgi:hypothetical protein
MKPALLAAAIVLTHSLPLSADAAGASEPIDERLAALHGSSDLGLRVGVGAGANEPMAGGLTSSLSVTGRYSVLQGGLELAGDAAPLGRATYGALGGLAGLGVQDASGVRFDLLGSAGMGSWKGLGCGLFCDSGGGSASLPYVGFRVGIAYAFTRRARAHFVLGLVGYYDNFYGSQDITYTTTSENGLFDSDTTTSQHSAHVAGHRSGAMVQLGVLFDLVKPDAT